MAHDMHPKKQTTKQINKCRNEENVPVRHSNLIQGEYVVNMQRCAVFVSDVVYCPFFSIVFQPLSMLTTDLGQYRLRNLKYICGE